MAQINFHTTPEFEQALAALMKARGLRSRSEAIRAAVQEAAEPYLAEPCDIDREIEAVQAFFARLADSESSKTGAELLAELDREMDEKFDRLAKGSWSSTPRR